MPDHSPYRPCRQEGAPAGAEQRHVEAWCDEPTEAIPVERNRYFTGKFLTARDFRDEQAYFLQRHRLHNRLMHGQGIVCGLDVTPHPQASCQDSWVVVAPGIAIDCHGRELIFDAPRAVKVWEPPAQPEHPKKQAEGESEAASARFLVFLSYCETPAEIVPAIYAEAQCHDAQRMEPSRVRETAQLCVRRIEPGDESCWPVAQHAEPDDKEYECDDCTTVDGSVEAACLRPNCRCGGRVPLALVTPAWDEKNGTYMIGEGQINRRGRQYINAPAQLTHIVRLNWRHGEKIRLAHLRDRMQRELRVYFDRKLLDDPGAGVGISRSTFVVQRYDTRTRDGELSPTLLYDDKRPPRLEKGCIAVFPIDDELLGGSATLKGSTISVQLKCDFILDCREIPVDGDHLRGRLPSGNGVPGGTFESWFHVMSADEERAEENINEQRELEEKRKWLEEERRKLEQQRRQLEPSPCAEPEAQR